MHLKIFILFTAIAICSSCSSRIQKEENNLALPEDFLTFFERFHADSIYQMEHILFPLEGMPSGLNEEAMIFLDNFRWTPEMWKMHKPFQDEDQNFNRHYHIINEELIEENITLKEGNFGMIRRFAKMGGEWYLIYYADLNRMSDYQDL